MAHNLEDELTMSEAIQYIETAEDIGRVGKLLM
jgi:hypothetical protein